MNDLIHLGGGAYARGAVQRVPVYAVEPARDGKTVRGETLRQSSQGKTVGGKKIRQSEEGKPVRGAYPCGAVEGVRRG